MKKRKPMTNRTRNALIGYAFISIWIVGFLIFSAYPLIRSFVFSFQKVILSGSRGVVTEGIWFNNYVRIFTEDLEFLRRLQEFVLELVLYVPVILIVSLIIAMMLNQNIRLRGFFRSIYFLPVVIVSGPIVSELLSQGAGSLSVAQNFNIEETLGSFLPAFIARPIGSLFTETIMILWFSGVQIVLLLVGLQKMDKDIYEAAQIDGASSWEMFWKITLPAMKNIIYVTAIYTTVMLSTFSNNPVVSYIKSSNVMFGSDKGYGYASSLAWIYFIVVVIILLLITLVLGNRREKKVKK